MIDITRSIIELNKRTFPATNSTVYILTCWHTKARRNENLTAFVSILISKEGEIKSITNELPEENDLYTLACKYVPELVPMLLRYKNITKNANQQFKL